MSNIAIGLESGDKLLLKTSSFCITKDIVFNSKIIFQEDYVDVVKATLQTLLILMILYSKLSNLKIIDNRPREFEHAYAMFIVVMGNKILFLLSFLMFGPHY